MACPNTRRPQSLVAQCNPSLSADLGRARSAAAARAQHMRQTHTWAGVEA